MQNHLVPKRSITHFFSYLTYDDDDDDVEEEDLKRN